MGNLSKFGSGEAVFKDQIHSVLVSLLLHLADPNPQVVKVGNCDIQQFPRFVTLITDSVTCARSGLQVRDARVRSCGGIGADHRHVSEPPARGQEPALRRVHQ